MARGAHYLSKQKKVFSSNTSKMAEGSLADLPPAETSPALEAPAQSPQCSINIAVLSSPIKAWTTTTHFLPLEIRKVLFKRSFGTQAEKLLLSKLGEPAPPYTAMLLKLQRLQAGPQSGLSEHTTALCRIPQCSVSPTQVQVNQLPKLEA